MILGDVIKDEHVRCRDDSSFRHPNWKIDLLSTSMSSHFHQVDLPLDKTDAFSFSPRHVAENAPAKV